MSPDMGINTGIINSRLGDWSQFLDSLESQLYGISDHSILSCGCIVSEKKIVPNRDIPFVCTICGNSCYYVGPLNPLRSITKLVSGKRQSLGLGVLAGMDQMRSDSTTSDVSILSSSVGETLSNTTSITNLDIALVHPFDENSANSRNLSTAGAKIGLLGLLKSAADALSREKLASSTTTTTTPSIASASLAQIAPVASATSEVSRDVEDWIAGLDLHTGVSTAEAEIREFNFYKCFPIFRKKFLHNTQTRGLLQRSSKNPILATAISPDCTKFVLVGKFKWLIYSIPPDFNDVPILIHTIDPSLESPPKEGHNWDNPMVAMTNSLMCVASASGLLRVYEITPTGFHMTHDQQSDFGIHCMALSPHGTMIAYAIIGRDKSHNDIQPMIVLRTLGVGADTSSPTRTRAMSFNSMSSVSSLPSTASRFETGKSITVTSPYRDPISTLSFSQDECYLTCSTYSESRFLVISVINPLEPRMVLKSSRRVDPDEHYEGITSVRLFPDSSRYMVVTSSAVAAPPIVLDTKIAHSSSALSDHSTLVRPSLLMRVDKVGTQIHSCEISPRGDAVAFLDKNGLIYIMHSPGMTIDTRRITIVTEVNGSSSYKQAATMRFSPSGHVLFAVDKRGNLHIEDFAAGLPHHAGLGKCRILA